MSRVTPADVSAIVVTRGDIDIRPVLHNLCDFDEVIVWDNSKRSDLSCYGRFAAIAEARNELIYVQDDDVLVPASYLVKRWEGKREILANKKPEEEWRFLGIGAIFPRDFVSVFKNYTERWEQDPEFYRVSDVVFAYQHPYRSVWIGYGELEWSRAANRMYHMADHYDVRIRARDRVMSLGHETGASGGD